MIECLKEISKEEYLLMKDKSPNEIRNYIESQLPVAILCGNGFYGGTLVEKDNKYFMKYLTGSSCD